MYPAKPGLLIGFHGCEEALRDDIIAGRRTLNPSQNRYDWLGNGIYFWAPVNRTLKDSKDLLIRELDCAVIEYLHQDWARDGHRPFDSVRGVFTEGKELYPGAGFRDKNHIQLCIRNPNCIKGYFLPRKETRWPLAS